MPQLKLKSDLKVSDIKAGDILVLTYATPKDIGTIVRVVYTEVDEQDEYANVEILAPSVTSSRKVGNRHTFYVWRFEKVNGPIDSNSLSPVAIKIRQMEQRFKARNQHA